MSTVPQPVLMAHDRSIRVPGGNRIHTDYVNVFAVRLECRDRMAVGDVAAAYDKCLQLGRDEQFPCPTGYWEGETFVLLDGRHHWIASIMLGKTHILVAWIEETHGGHDGAQG